jgi:hypothetical protein
MEFLERVFLQSIGPLVSAIVGTLIIGGLLAQITRKAQERRADNQLRENRIRAEHQLRIDLIGQMTQAGSALYMACQHYWRKKSREQTAPEALAVLRQELDKQYRDSRVAGEVLERKLEAYFESTNPRALWHATMDLLTVRYFHLIELDKDSLLQANAGALHSRLSLEQLRDQGLILKTYKETLLEASQAVLSGAIRPFAG